MKFRLFGRVFVVPGWVRILGVGVVVAALLLAGILTEYRDGKDLLNSISATDCGPSDYNTTIYSFSVNYTPEPTNTSEPTLAPNLLRVYIIGEINNPGVYSIADGSILWDLVELAGGLTDIADPAAINMAHLLADHMMVNIPKIGESYSAWIVDAGSSGNAGFSSGLVNINTATVAELCTLPGVGESTAQKIIRYRTANGPFATIEDIMNVSGIKESRFSEIKGLITV